MYKNYVKIDKVLSQTAKNYKLESAVHKYKALKAWEKAASGFIVEAKGQTKAIDLRQGILVVACLTKEIAYQIKLLAQRIIYEINKLLGKSIVFAISVEC